MSELVPREWWFYDEIRTCPQLTQLILPLILESRRSYSADKSVLLCSSMQLWRSRHNYLFSLAL